MTTTKPVGQAHTQAIIPLKTAKNHISVPPYPIAANILAGNAELGYFGQFNDLRGYIGVQFNEADGIHYGALDMAASSDSAVMGIFYGYGCNPVPGAPFDLSEIPSVPEPSKVALLALGTMFMVGRRRLR